MSPPASAESFVPFEPPMGAGGKPSSPPATLKIVSRPETGPVFNPLQTFTAAHAHSPSGASGKPVVVLQREGERITGIRIECVCGQVIELACSY